MQTKGAVVEAVLDHVHVQEAAEHQVVVELLAEQPLPAHRVERHQQARLQQPLRWHRRSPFAEYISSESRRQLSQRRIRELLDPS